MPRGKGTQGWKSRVGHGQKGFTGMVPEVWKWLRLGLPPLIISFCWDGNYKAFSKKIEGRPDSNTFMLANFEISPRSTNIIARLPGRAVNSPLKAPQAICSYGVGSD